jgi:hypothetical protein
MTKELPDDAALIECRFCGQLLTYGDARAVDRFPALGYEDGPGSLRSMAVLECRCGRTAVDLQQRGQVLIAIPRSGDTLQGSSGPDASLVLGEVA